MRVARPVVLEEQERKALEQLARGRSLPLRLVERTRIVLRARPLKSQSRCCSVALGKAVYDQIQRGLQSFLSVIFRDSPLRQVSVDVHACQAIDEAAQSQGK